MGCLRRPSFFSCGDAVGRSTILSAPFLVRGMSSEVDDFAIDWLLACSVMW